MAIAPVIAGIAAAASAGSGIAGVVEGAQAGGRQQKALTQQEAIAQQEATDKQQAFKQLTDFFTPYLQQGSPFLANIQRAAAESNATQANNAAGAVRGGVQRSGLGYGPSGTEAAALGGVATQAAQQGSTNYLQNLLNNEMVKFQAAQGIQGAGQMAGSPQNQPNVSAQLPYQSLGSGLSGLSDILKGLLGTSQAGSLPGIPGGQLPTGGYPGGPPAAPPIQPPALPGVPGISGSPTTQGWNLGGQ
jgi:hypothetical protein